MVLFHLRSSIKKFVVKTLIIRSLSVLLSVVSGVCTAYSKEKDWIRSVIAFDVSTNVVRGGDVEILLTSVPNYGNTVNFEIQALPQHGTISAPVNQSDHSATVIYHHNGTKNSLEDYFSFRASSVGRAKSVAYRATISIHAPPANLVFKPQIFNFGGVIVSETCETYVTISNIGGMKYNGKILLPNQFSAPDGDEIALDEGESKNIRICFTPITEGKISEEACILPSSEERPIMLKGTGLPRYQVEKVDGVSWKIKNLSTNEIRINFSGGEGWTMPSEVPIARKSESTVSFKQNDIEDGETNIVSKDTHVQISDGLSTNVIELPQPKRFAPLSVKQLSPDYLGSFPIGSPIHVAFQFQNRTDSPKYVKWRAMSASGGGMSEAKSMAIEGGSVEKIDWDWMPSLPGEATLRVSVTDGSKSLPELLWKAKMYAGMSAQNPSPSLGITSALEAQKVDPSPTPIPQPKILENQIPPIDDISWGTERSWMGQQSQFVEWKSPSNSVATVAVEEITLVRPNVTSVSNRAEVASLPPSMKFQLLPLKFVEQRKEDNRRRASMIDLSPGCHLLRVTILNNHGAPMNSSTIQVQILPNPSFWNSLKMPIGIMALILLGLFLRTIRRGS